MGTCRPASLRIAPLVLILLPVTVLASSHVSGTSLAGSPPTTPPGTSPAATSGAGPSPILTFEDRVAAQEAIERIYYAHQIGATKPFEEVVTREILEEKVRTYLKKTVALEKIWKTPVTAETLLKEMERIAAGTRLPDRLEAIYAVLGHDPILVQECLVRPVVVDRLARAFFASDVRLHADSRRQAEALRERLLTGRYDLPQDDSSPSITDIVLSAEEAPDLPEAEAASPADGVRSQARTSGNESLTLHAEEFHRVRAQAPAEVGEVGALVEEPDAFSIRIVLEETPGSFRLLTYRIPKTPWETWWSGVEETLDESEVEPVASADGSPPALELSTAPAGRIASASPAPASAGCSQDNLWDPTALRNPTSTVSLSTPVTAVWTGTLMISWGGYYSNAGERYDAVTDLWTPTTTLNAPSVRGGASVIWTGTEMIVWGGTVLGSYYLNTGGRYDPQTDTWLPTSTVNAPEARDSHSAVWTGSRMLIYGGKHLWNPNPGGPLYLLTMNSGGSYDPQTDSWSYVPGMPNTYWGRSGHSAVWTGAEMIVWGGDCRDYPNYPPPCNPYGPQYSGSRFNPMTGTWTAISITNAPMPRSAARAVWTGSLMLVWGNGPGGGRYAPSSDSWSPITTVNAWPTTSSTTGTSIVWTGSSMIAWGGSDGATNYNDGGRYDPVSDVWSPTTKSGAPSPLSGHAAVWTGTVMVVRGGGSGDFRGRYDPIADSWLPVAPAPITISSRASHTAVWTGSLMLIWGGWNGSSLRGGGRYDAVTDSWSQIPLLHAPSARSSHTAVWTGSEMIVW